MSGALSSVRPGRSNSIIQFRVADSVEVDLTFHGLPEREGEFPLVVDGQFLAVPELLA